MGTRNRRYYPPITIHISRAQNSIWFRPSPDHKQTKFKQNNLQRYVIGSIPILE